MTCISDWPLLSSGTASDLTGTHGELAAAITQCLEQALVADVIAIVQLYSKQLKLLVLQFSHDSVLDPCAKSWRLLRRDSWSEEQITTGVVWNGHVIVCRCIGSAYRLARVTSLDPLTSVPLAHWAWDVGIEHTLVAHGDCIYVCGSHRSYQCRQAYRHNLVTGVRTILPLMAHGRCGAAGVVHAGKLWAIGGTTVTANVEILDLSSDASHWTDGGVNTIGEPHCGARYTAALLQDFIYMCKSNGIVCQRFHVQSRGALTSMRQPVFTANQCLRMVVIDDRLLLFGHGNGMVQSYNPASDEWSMLLAERTVLSDAQSIALVL